MTIEEIRANAPSDATHFNKWRSAFVKIEKGRVYEWIIDKWIYIDFKKNYDYEIKPL